MSLLARLRRDLDFMPSPIKSNPGLLIRDSMRYSDVVLVIPPPLVPALACFDGQRTEADLRAEIVRLTGRANGSSVAAELEGILHRSGFLENEVFEEMRLTQERAFRESGVRSPVHAGTAYPARLSELETVMARYLSPGGEAVASSRAIAAPHVSPEGGWESYRAAYTALPPSARDRTFVVLGTSHYGSPHRFGLTAKPYETPWGMTRTAPELLRQLEPLAAAKQEDYCHSVEHSIEFQVVFLQSLFGPQIRVLPILVGPFDNPEADDAVRQFCDALGELNAREGDRLLWVLGVDMTHVGRRYGDAFPAIAGEDGMVQVAERDLSRIERINAADPKGFWEQIDGRNDDLKWCGSAPLYTFLKAVPNARGTLRKYEQWNIDPASVVSFAGIVFE